MKDKMTNDLLPCPDVDALLAREMQITLTMFRNRGEPLKASEIMTQVSTEKFAQIMEFALRHYNSTPNKPAEVDLDALKKTHKEWLPSNKKDQDICNLGWNRCIDWLYKNGHLATGKGVK